MILDRAFSASVRQIGTPLLTYLTTSGSASSAARESRSSGRNKRSFSREVSTDVMCGFCLRSRSRNVSENKKRKIVHNRDAAIAASAMCAQPETHPRHLARDKLISSGSERSFKKG